MAGYYAAVEQGKRSGRAGRVVPTSLPGSGIVTYRFVPSGGGGGSGGGYTGPSAPNRSRGGLDPATLGALGKAAAYYAPGGGFGKGTEAGLERERTQVMSSGMQSLVSSGLAGTTMAAGLGKKFSEEVGMPTRMRVEETRAQRLSAIDVLKAQLTQGASESAAQRALQEFIARMSSETSLALGSMRSGGGGGGAGFQSPTIRYTPQQAESQPQSVGGRTTTFVDEASPFSGLGISAGVSSGNLISDVDWADIQAKADTMSYGPGTFSFDNAPIRAGGQSLVPQAGY